jgi:dsDNA-specific endonuclease/ATPase MutS2
LVAQHHSASKPFVHYTSPRFRRDAKDQLSEFTNKFNTLISSLIKARYLEAMELEKKLAVIEQKALEAERMCDLLRVEAEITAETSRQALEKKQEELDQVIAMYRQSLAQ